MKRTGRDQKGSGKLKRLNRIKLYSRKQHGHWKQSTSAKGLNKKRNSPGLQRNETIKTMRKQSIYVCLRVCVCVTKHGQGFLQYIFEREGWIGLIHSLSHLEKVTQNNAGGEEARLQSLRKGLSK